MTACVHFLISSLPLSSFKDHFINILCLILSSCLQNKLYHIKPSHPQAVKTPQKLVLTPRKFNKVTMAMEIMGEKNFMACSHWGWRVFGQTSIYSYAEHTPSIFREVLRLKGTISIFLSPSIASQLRWRRPPKLHPCFPQPLYNYTYMWY